MLNKKVMATMLTGVMTATAVAPTVTGNEQNTENTTLLSSKASEKTEPVTFVNNDLGKLNKLAKTEINSMNKVNPSTQNVQLGNDVVMGFRPDQQYINLGGLKFEYKNPKELNGWTLEVTNGKTGKAEVKYGGGLLSLSSDGYLVINETQKGATIPLGQQKIYFKAIAQVKVKNTNKYEKKTETKILGSETVKIAPMTYYLQQISVALTAGKKYIYASSGTPVGYVIPKKLANGQVVVTACANNSTSITFIDPTTGKEMPNTAYVGTALLTGNTVSYTRNNNTIAPNSIPWATFEKGVINLDGTAEKGTTTIKVVDESGNTISTTTTTGTVGVKELPETKIPDEDTIVSITNGDKNLGNKITDLPTTVQSGNQTIIVKVKSLAPKTGKTTVNVVDQHGNVIGSSVTTGNVGTAVTIPTISSKDTIISVIENNKKIGDKITDVPTKVKEGDNTVTIYVNVPPAKAYTTTVKIVDQNGNVINSTSTTGNVGTDIVIPDVSNTDSITKITKKW